MCIHMYIYLYLYKYTSYEGICMYLYVSIHTNMYVYTHVCTNENLYVHRYIYIHTYIDESNINQSYNLLKKTLVHVHFTYAVTEPTAGSYT